MREIWNLAAAAMLPTLSCAGFGQSENSLVGTWKLVSASSSTDQAVFGVSPSGFLTYTADGRMTAMIANDGRKPLSNADIPSAPVEERAQAFSTFIAYAGRYAFTGRQVIHHVEVASIQNWVNTDLTRDVTLKAIV